MSPSTHFPTESDGGGQKKCKKPLDKRYWVCYTNNVNKNNILKKEMRYLSWKKN